MRSPPSAPGLHGHGAVDQEPVEYDDRRRRAGRARRRADGDVGGDGRSCPAGCDVAGPALRRPAGRVRAGQPVAGRDDQPLAAGNDDVDRLG